MASDNIDKIYPDIEVVGRMMYLTIRLIETVRVVGSSASSFNFSAWAIISCSCSCCKTCWRWNIDTPRIVTPPSNWSLFGTFDDDNVGVVTISFETASFSEFKKVSLTWAFPSRSWGVRSLVDVGASFVSNCVKAVLTVSGVLVSETDGGSRVDSSRFDLQHHMIGRKFHTCTKQRVHCMGYFLLEFGSISS